MIIAVDFDGTLELKDQQGKKIPNTLMMDRLRFEQARGNIVILWTCREGRALIEAVNYFVTRQMNIKNFLILLAK